MATNSTTEPKQHRSLYPTEHPRKRERYYFDDTLDAYPPYHLFRGKPTLEAMGAAKQLAAEHGYPPPHFPSEIQDSQDGQGQDTPAAASSANGALAARSERSAEPSRAREKKE